MLKSIESEMLFDTQNSCLVIAEIGVNHNGDVQKAKKLSSLAIECGADLVKFQIFDSEEEISQHADMADYQKQNSKTSGSQLEMAKKLELSSQDQLELYAYCKKQSIPVIYSVFDNKSLDFALNVLGVSVIKIPSGDLTNYPLLEKIASSGVDILLSTGCSFQIEIDRAVEFIRSNMILPRTQSLMLFQCVSEYPAPLEESNLWLISKFRGQYDLKVGLSDHSNGIEVAVLSVAAGASAIEKHFTFDKNAIGPDHAASIDPIELRQLCAKVREAEIIMGYQIKCPSPSEAKNRLLIRKSIVARSELDAGHILCISDLAFKRPGGGVSPTEFKSFLGKKLKNKKLKDQPILEEDV